MIQISTTLLYVLDYYDPLNFNGYLTTQKVDTNAGATTANAIHSATTATTIGATTSVSTTDVTTTATTATIAAAAATAVLISATVPLAINLRSLSMDVHDRYDIFNSPKRITTQTHLIPFQTPTGDCGPVLAYLNPPLSVGVIPTPADLN